MSATDHDEDAKFKKNAAKTAGEAEEVPDALKVKPLMRPADQEKLSEAQLKVEITRTLTCINPLLPTKEAEYSFALGEFVDKPPEETTSYALYSHQGTAIRKDGEEARAQIAAGYGAVNLDDSGPKKIKAKKTTEEEEEEEEEEPAADDDAPEEGQEPAEEAVADAVDEEVAVEGSGGDSDGEVDGEDEEEKVEIIPKAKKLANQFNFCERAALTVSYPSRSVETQTYPPPRATFSATALQSIIYDFYQKDYESKESEREGEKPKKVKKKIPQLKEKTEKELNEEKVQQRIKEGWTVLERLVNQNIYDEIGHDYRYWEDPSDEFREGDGSLLPLWRFSYERMRTSTVTALAWNPYYYDMFAVAYGSLDFIHSNKEGCLCLFTIKNPSFPEYAVMTDSPVICLDIHKKFPYLIVVGLYDGNVCVYNAQLANDKSHQYKSDSVESKHSSLVWEIRWGPDLADGECSFWSVSGDGRVTFWTVLPGELLAATAILLLLPGSGPNLKPIRANVSDNLAVSIIRADVMDTARLSKTLAKEGGESTTRLTIPKIYQHNTFGRCGTCLTSHPLHPEVYLVGTEEGLILRCSRAYSRAFLGVLNAHHMPVHTIHYNSYDGKVFATCSGDWRVKIWEDGRNEPLFMFDLGSSVGDVKWAPYSSTVFAACTSDGKVFVYDLNVNKYKPICVQNIVSKKLKKLTRLDFNYHLPILLCGDSKGTVHLVKLSPNLRVMCKAPKKQQHLDQRTLQEMKLTKLLSLVREPPTEPEVVDEKIEDD